jgi:poly-gamma-glutamate synthesis protein (capsule biosynthesis protein)
MTMLLAGVGDLVVMKPLRHLRERPPGSLLDVLAEADLAVGNLEVPLTAIDNPQKEGIVLRAEPELLDDVAAAGLDAVSLANNHAADQGWPALEELAARCRAAGVLPLGVGGNVGSALEPVIHQVEGLRIALLAATCVSMERFLATDGRPGLAGVRCQTEFEHDLDREGWEPGFRPSASTRCDPADSARLVAAVDRARRRSDLVVAAMHWGVSHQPGVADYQRELARALVAAGAGVVFGCHAHDLQGVEVIAGAPVFYGLGSFVFGYDGPGEGAFPRDSAVALVEVAADGRVEHARLILGRLDESGEPRRSGPERAEHLAEALRRWSQGWGAAMERQADVLQIALR